MTKNQYEWARTLLIILLVIIIIGTVILLIWTIVAYVNRPAPGPTPGPGPSPIPVVDQDPGASVAGAANFHNGEELTDAAMCVAPTGTWDGGASRCDCIQPFFGRQCGREAHNETYYGLGEVSNSKSGTGLVYTKVQVPPPNTPYGMRLSFKFSGGLDNQSCTGLCDQRDDCFGVEYDGTNCALITSNPELVGAATVTVDPNVEPDIYLYRTGVRPVVKNRVFGYTGQRPLRFWAQRSPYSPQAELVDASDSLVIKTGGSLVAGAAPAGIAPASDLAWATSNAIPGGADVFTFWQGRVVAIPFAPQRVVNDGAMLGVYSTSPFKPADFGQLSRGGAAGVFVDRGGRGSDYQLPIPSNMRQKPLFVMYNRLLAGPITPPTFFN